LSRENATTVAGICRRLDGLPLAIELAAVRIKLLTPEALLRRLDRRLPLLTGGARDLPTRQQTLRDAITWSYDLLTPEEQRLFRRLGIFVGGFTVEAAEAVGDAEGDLGIEPLDGMGSLAGKSLLRGSETTDGEPRFEMLVTIREFAREQLELSGEAATFRARHARYYRDLVEEIAPRLHGPHQARWLDLLDAEHGNLRAAMAWSADHDLDLALDLGGALWRFWQVRGHVPEGRAWLERVVTADAARPATPPTPSRARALNAVAFLAFMAGDYERATARYRETLAIRRALDDREGIAESLNNLGLTLRCIGDHRGANDLFEQALHQTRALGNRAREANILNNLARSAYYRGQYAAAEALHEQALTAGRESGDDWAVAICLGDLGDVHQAQGDADTARWLYEQSLAAWRALGDLRGVAQCLEGFAGLIVSARPEQAVRLFGAGSAVREAIGEPSSLPRRAQLEQTLARLRATLGPERFGAAWSEGRSLSAEQAVEVALAPSSADPAASSDVSDASSTSNGWRPPGPRAGR
jgi:tetratricopeptide (TPR) repeat protein